MPKPWEVTSEEARKWGERNRERSRAADAQDTDMFLRHLTHELEDEDPDFLVSLPNLHPRSANVIPVTFRDHRVELCLDKAAGVELAFPKSFSLPADWFQDTPRRVPADVELCFERDAGAWMVHRIGTRLRIHIEFWSADGKLHDDTIVVTATPKKVPIAHPADVSSIVIVDITER